MERKGFNTIKITIFLIFANLFNIQAFICDPSESVCETELEITYRMTMIDDVLGAVYPSNGSLYKLRDKNNDNDSRPISTDGVITADGWTIPRLVIVANRTMPGPTIIATKGQRLKVKVINKLRSETVAIHWHGIIQKGTPYMDGVPFITQCPILPGNFFTYEFDLLESGTYFYHSHIAVQQADGLFGALIIQDTNEDATQDSVLQVQEWNHDFRMDLLSQTPVLTNNVVLTGIYAESRAENKSMTYDGTVFSVYDAQSLLINGRGRYYDPATGNYTEAPLDVITVKKGIIKKFRLIGAGIQYPIRVSIDDHDLTVVSSDGQPIEPITVESVVVHPGERYDFTVETNKAVANYWIRARTLESNKVTLVGSIMSYEEAEVAEPNSTNKNCSPSDKCTVFNCPFKYFPESSFTRCIGIETLRYLLTSGISKILVNKASDIHIDGSSNTLVDRASYISVDRTSELSNNGTLSGLANISVNESTKISIDNNSRMSSDPTSKGLADGVSKVSIDGVRQEFLNFRLKRSPSIHPTTNDIQFKDPSVPFILHPDELAKDCNGVSCSNDTVCKCTQSISVGFMEPLILIFVVFGIDKEPHHPIHVHGHSFRILKVGYPEYDETSGHIISKNRDLNCGYSNQTYGCEWTYESWALGQIPGLELTNPPKKDTVVVPSGGYVIVHITADNPGTWIIHCHVESHVLNGMSIVLNEVPGQIPKPPKGFPSCGDFPPIQKYRTEPQINCSYETTMTHVQPVETSATPESTTLLNSPFSVTNDNISNANETYENCTDNPMLDCRFFNYTQVCSQDSVYRPWASKNCPAYCGICFVPPTFTPCVDKLFNCEEYNADLCSNPLYRFFREENCRKYCNLCT